MMNRTTSLPTKTDRRELRASRVVAAWVGHTDSREANTLDTWIRDRGNGAGHVEHDLLDFGDCLGSMWEPPSLGRRVGQSAHFDAPDVLVDWLSLGAILRPWETPRFGRFGRVLGYSDVAHFDPESWTPGYDNPAMLRMTERDAAFMSRRIARLQPARLRLIIAEARLDDPALARMILVTLEGRRRRILERDLVPLSPLGWPTVAVETAASSRHGTLVVCVEDLMVSSGAHLEPRLRHEISAHFDRRWSRVDRRPAAEPHRQCALVPFTDRVPEARSPRMLIEWRTRPPPGATAATSSIRLHLWRRAERDVNVIGLERHAEPRD
ncbi:MAG: hypothetical protein FJ096_20260 [Deltaproteobacteria bacterium]|nr:hypothetical protein [Deltaproteobacteria bacterium]